MPAEGLAATYFPDGDVGRTRLKGRYRDFMLFHGGKIPRKELISRKVDAFFKKSLRMTRTLTFVGLSTRAERRDRSRVRLRAANSVVSGNRQT
jgi:hypothetical protein